MNEIQDVKIEKNVLAFDLQSEKAILKKEKIKFENLQLNCEEELEYTSSIDYDSLEAFMNRNKENKIDQKETQECLEGLELQLKQIQEKIQLLEDVQARIKFYHDEISLFCP